MKDDTGAIFIDRDPDVFAPILNYLRTRHLEFGNVDLKALKHEAEFYGILPLMKQLAVCDELEKSNCGSLLFYSQLQPPVFDQMPPPSENTPQPQLPLGLKTGNHKYTCLCFGCQPHLGSERREGEKSSN